MLRARSGPCSWAPLLRADSPPPTPPTRVPGPGLRSPIFSPAPTLSRAGAAGLPENQPAGKMWATPVLLWILGSASLWVPAQPASVPGLEDIVTPGVDIGKVNPGKEDHLTTVSGSAVPQPSPHVTAWVPPSTEHTTHTGFEDVLTPGSSTHRHQKSQATTASPMVTSTTSGNITQSTQIAVGKDSLSAGTLAGIVFGILFAFAFLGCILFLFVRKISK